MGWRGSLALDYRADAARTVVHDRHDGPAARPEEPASGRRRLPQRARASAGRHRRRRHARSIAVALDAGAHALVTTPGATRFYRSPARPREQSTTVDAAAGSRIEWLPLETIAYSGCEADEPHRAAPRAGCRDDRLGRDRARPAGVGAALRRGPLHAVDRAAGPLARPRARCAPTTRACSTRRSAGTAVACWRRCGSRPAARSSRRVATICSPRRARSHAATRCAASAGATAPQRRRRRRPRAGRSRRAGDGPAGAHLARLASDRLGPRGCVPRVWST